MSDKSKQTTNCSFTPIQTKVSQFLMSYHTIPHGTTGETPAELFLKDPLKLDLTY